MDDHTSTWETTTSDILIIGGGFGGLWAAVRAAECGVTVILVDKSFAGKSGHSYFASGNMMVLLPEDNLDNYIYDITVGNAWLVDQEMVVDVFKGSYQRLKDLESCGIPFKQSNGKYVRTKARGTTHIQNVWPENATAAEVVTTLRKIALSKGVKFIDHVYIYDLLKSEEDHIVGAIGIGVNKAINHYFKAKSVILATNSGGFKGHHLASELQGTGPFMAYDAGAKIKNPEFHYINIRPTKHEIEGSGIFPAIGAKWINAKGKHFMAEYDTVLQDRAPVAKIVVAAAKEAQKGNTPISIDVESMSEEERERFRILMVSHGWQPILFEKCKHQEGYDILRDNIEWQPAYESNKLGIYADTTCATNLPGLFAAGMARTLGINPFTGWSIASCIWSGYTAGESASKYAQENDFKEIDFHYLLGRKKKFFAPLRRESGTDPDKIIYNLQKILFPADVLIIMSEPRLKNALDQTIRLEEEQLFNLKAKDTRTLIKSKEIQTMVLAAKMTLQASLMRKETREGLFYRKDFIDADNKNWLKWIIVEKDQDEAMNFTTVAIPFEKYRYQPELMDLA